MRIIKVTHGDSAQEIDLEKRLMLLEDYDIDSFISRHGSDIIKQSSTEVTELSGMEALKNPQALLSGAKHLLRLRKPPSAQQIEDLKETNVVSIKTVIANTILALLLDIRNQASDHVEVVSLAHAREKYQRTQNLSIGTYSLHPYDSGRLTRLEHYHLNLALEKDNELIMLLGKMGARTVRIIEAGSQQRSGSFQTGAEAIAVEAGGNSSVAQRIEQGKELLVTFEGNITEISPELLATSLWFGNDGQLNAIFESRRFTPNQIQEYTLRSTYTETFDFNFSLAGRYLVVKTDLQAEYEAISKKERLFHVEFGKGSGIRK